MSESIPLRVVIVGGSVGAMEAMLGLHALAGDRVRTTLVAPSDTAHIAALRTLTSFTHRRVPPISLRTLVRRSGAEFRPGAVRRVVPERKTVLLSDGSDVEYDALVLAIGARAVPAYDQHALTFGAELSEERIGDVITDVAEGYADSIAFVVPPGASWTLPLYELALLSAQRLAQTGAHARLELITPEPAPLAIFGPPASEAISEVLDDAGITVHANAYAELVRPGTLRLTPDGHEVSADRIVALPRLIGPGLHGVPSDQDGFIPIDERCRVRGIADVFAVGDATTFPVKQGGLACQMADTVAEGLAARAGADVEPRPFRPVLQGQLLAGRRAGMLRKEIQGGGGDADVAFRSVFEPATKVAGRFLSEALTGERGYRGTVPGLRVDIDLPPSPPPSADPLTLEPYSPERTP
jgi:sulfide:quinone oxidoreductase